MEFDIEKDTEAHKRYREYGGRGVPFIVVEGTVLRGFSEQAITAAVLAKRQGR